MIVYPPVSHDGQSLLGRLDVTERPDSQKQTFAANRNGRHDVPFARMTREERLQTNNKLAPEDQSARDIALSAKKERKARKLNIALKRKRRDVIDAATIRIQDKLAKQRRERAEQNRDNGMSAESETGALSRFTRKRL